MDRALADVLDGREAEAHAFRAPTVKCSSLTLMSGGSTGTLEFACTRAR